MNDTQHIVTEICKLAAELADRVEEEHNADFGVFKMSFRFPEDPYNPDGLPCPVTLSIEAQWVQGEWKYTRRTRLEELG